MTEGSVTHATIAIERTYDASARRVFSAFAEPSIKARWFGGPDDWNDATTVFDFRVGGREYHSSEMDGQVHTFDGRYCDIVADQRIVYAYEMRVGATRISVSLATVDLEPADAGTRMVFTEQGAFLDGHDTGALREHGTGALLDALGAELERQAAEAS